MQQMGNNRHRWIQLMEMEAVVLVKSSYKILKIMSLNQFRMKLVRKKKCVTVMDVNGCHVMVYTINLFVYEYIAWLIVGMWKRSILMPLPPLPLPFYSSNTCSYPIL